MVTLAYIGCKIKQNAVFMDKINIMPQTLPIPHLKFVISLSDPWEDLIYTQ